LVARFAEEFGRPEAAHGNGMKSALRVGSPILLINFILTFL